MDRRHWIDFTLAGLACGDFVVGSLPWPYRVKRVQLFGDVAEVWDSRGIATFHLGDIHLSDLSVR